MSVKCRRWVLKSHFIGMPKREDLDLVEEELPSLKDGGEGVKINQLEAIFMHGIMPLHIS